MINNDMTSNSWVTVISQGEQRGYPYRTFNQD